MNIQEYKNKLQKLDDNNSDELISNGSERHAIALIKILLTNAKHNVNIISSKLSFYSNTSVIEALKTALNNNISIQLLLDNYKNSGIDNNNKFLQICKNHKNCDVRTYDKQLDAHIITRDGKAFRYCERLGSNTAVASFNYPNAAKNADKKAFGEHSIFSEAPRFS